MEVKKTDTEIKQCRRGKINTEDYFLNIAKAISERSSCYYWKVGAVIVNEHGEIVGTGYNGSADSFSNSCLDCNYCLYEQEHGVKPDGTQEKCAGIHAELYAMLHAQFAQMHGATIYVYGYDRENNKSMDIYPDPLISKLIRNCGIKQIVTGRDSIEG